MNYSKGIYSNREWLKKHYVRQHFSLRKIAKMCKVNFKTIDFWVKKFNFIKHPVGSKGMKREKCHRWKGGKTIVNGYIVIYENGHKYIPEHRIIAEKCLGRKLLQKEVIHHIDGNRTNNNPQNLYLFPSNNEHKAFEHLSKRISIPPLISNLSMNE